MNNEVVTLLAQFEKQFGESAPLMQLPTEEIELARVLREAIETNDVRILEQQIPVGADA